MESLIIGHPYLSIVIPAFNEAKRLSRTLTRLHEYLKRQEYSWEILVVSNGSKDATESVVRAAKAEIPGLHLIVLEQRGKGRASRVGALSSKGDVLFLCDADLSMPPDRLSNFLILLKDNDVVVGSREAVGSTRYHEPRHRHVMGRIFNRLVQLLAVSGIEDTQCGFKAFRREIVEELFSRQRVSGYAFDVELLYLARKFRYRVHEFGIDWYFDADTRVRPGIDSVDMIKEVFAIRFRDAFGRYARPVSLPVSTYDVG